MEVPKKIRLGWWTKEQVSNLVINKGNSSIPLFETHKSIEENESGLPTKTAGNALNTRGEQRHNIKM